MRFIVFFWLSFAAVCFSTRSYSADIAPPEKPEIMWYFIDFPPAYINKGPYKDQGYADKTFQYIIDRMPQYRHTKMQSNFPRALHAVQDQSHACHTGLLRTPEREQYVYYSDPIGPTVPNRLLILQKNMHRFTPHLGASGELLLGSLMRSGDLRVGIINGRFYSHNINRELERFRGSNKIVKVPYEMSANLLLRNRIDYTFSWLAEAAYLFRKVEDEKPNKTRDTYTLLPISGEPTVRYGLFSCRRNAFGKQVVDDMNTIIRAKSSAAIFEKFYTDWLDDDALKLYKQAARKFAQDRD